MNLEALILWYWFTIRYENLPHLLYWNTLEVSATKFFINVHCSCSRLFVWSLPPLTVAYVLVRALKNSTAKYLCKVVPTERYSWRACVRFIVVKCRTFLTHSKEGDFFNFYWTHQVLVCIFYCYCQSESETYFVICSA